MASSVTNLSQVIGGVWILILTYLFWMISDKPVSSLWVDIFAKLSKIYLLSVVEVAQSLQQETGGEQLQASYTCICIHVSNLRSTLNVNGLLIVSSWHNNVVAAENMWISFRFFLVRIEVGHTDFHCILSRHIKWLWYVPNIIGWLDYW